MLKELIIKLFEKRVPRFFYFFSKIDKISVFSNEKEKRN